MEKKGQITIFIIIAILVLTLIISFIYLTKQNPPEIQEIPSSYADSINSHISLCIDDLLKESILEHGWLEKNLITSYFNENIGTCIDLSNFEKGGINIEQGSIDLDIESNEKMVFVKLSHPVSIKKGESSVYFNSFESKYLLINNRSILLKDGKTEENFYMNSPDKKLRLFVPKGTKALDQNGDPLSSISIRILSATSPSIGFFKYDLTPVGATFDSPIVLTIKYDDSDLPEKFHKQDLEIKYFDEDGNGRISLPSNIDVVNNKLTVEITHFSEFGLGVSDELDHQNQAFIISDKDWKNVFQLVPLTVWTQSNELHKHPLLIFHEEESSFDADSIIHFLQQYNANKVTLVGDTPSEFDNLLTSNNNFSIGLSDNQIQKISPETIIDYWNSYDNVVYVEDDYKLAMLASIYASLIDAPLIIKNGVLDRNSNFKNKRVIRIGTVDCPTNSTCDEEYNLRELQRKYIELTNTDKIILVNPNDISFYINEDFTPDLSGNSISQLYGKTSLAAPILAAAKHEVILFYDNVSGVIEKNGYCKRTNIEPIIEDIKSTLNEEIGSLPLNNKNYLTIIAAPNAIPDSEHMEGGHCVTEAQHGQRLATDRKLMDNIKTGRIYSLTISDVSSYIARSIFYDDLFSNIYPDQQYTGLTIAASIREHHNAFYVSMAGAINEITESAGYDAQCMWIDTGIDPRYADYCDHYFGSYPSEIGDRLMKKQFIIIYAHGSPTGTEYINTGNLPKLDLAYMNAFSCSTAYFWEAGSTSGVQPRADRFASRTLRKGGMGYNGIVGPGSSTGDCPNCLAYSSYVALGKLLTENATLGEVDSHMYNTMRREHNEPNVGFFTLLGDPTLTLKFREIDDWPSAKRMKL